MISHVRKLRLTLNSQGQNVFLTTLPPMVSAGKRGWHGREPQELGHHCIPSTCYAVCLTDISCMNQRIPSQNGLCPCWPCLWVYALAGHAFSIHPENLCSNSFSDKCWLSCSALWCQLSYLQCSGVFSFHQLLLVSHLGVGGRGNQCLGQILRPSHVSTALKEIPDVLTLRENNSSQANMLLSIPRDMVIIE